MPICLFFLGNKLVWIICGGAAVFNAGGDWGAVFCISQIAKGYGIFAGDNVTARPGKNTRCVACSANLAGG